MVPRGEREAVNDWNCKPDQQVADRIRRLTQGAEVGGQVEIVIIVADDVFVHDHARLWVALRVAVLQFHRYESSMVPGQRKSRVSGRALDTKSFQMSALTSSARR